MNYLKILTLAVVALIIASSCTIEHSVDFKEDMSGSSAIQIDMSEFVTQMSAMLPDSNISNETVFKDIDMEKEMEGINKDFEGADGLSNLTAIQNSEEGKVGFSFDFTDIEALNKGFDSTKKGRKSKKNHYLFELEKNKLKVNFSTEDIESFKLDDEESKAMMGMIEFNYAFTLNFPFTIKKVSNPIYQVSEDRKSVSFNLGLEEMTTKIDDLSTDITW